MRRFLVVLPAALAASIIGCDREKIPTQPPSPPSPPPLTFLTFVAVSPGDVHTCGVTTDGNDDCWGDNSAGELGDGTASDRSRPARVAGGLRIVTLGAGCGHTCGLTTGR